MGVPSTPFLWRRAHCCPQSCAERGTRGTCALSLGRAIQEEGAQRRPQALPRRSPVSWGRYHGAPDTQRPHPRAGGDESRVLGPAVAVQCSEAGMWPAQGPQGRDEKRVAPEAPADAALTPRGSRVSWSSPCV